jgi:hypothetical protein
MLFLFASSAVTSYVTGLAASVISRLSLCFLFRPRLGVTLHKVVVAGALYLLFSGMEGVLRVTGVSIV